MVFDLHPYYRYYVVGNLGSFDFYKKKNDYLQNDNAINSAPLRLNNFDAFWSSEDGSFGGNNNTTEGSSSSEGPSSSNMSVVNTQSEVRNALRHLITGSQDTKVREYLGGNQRRNSQDIGAKDGSTGRGSLDDGNKTVQAVAHLSFQLMPHSAAADHPTNLDASTTGALALLSTSTAGDAVEFRAETDAEYDLWLDFLKPYSSHEKAKRDGTPATFEDILAEMIVEPTLVGRDHKANFTTYRNVIEGRRLLTWLLENEWCSEQDQAAKVLQCMLKRGLLICPGNTSLKFFKSTLFFRLKATEPAVPDPSPAKTRVRNKSKDFDEPPLASVPDELNDLKIVVSPRCSLLLSFLPSFFFLPFVTIFSTVNYLQPTLPAATTDRRSSD